jgi:hypothetical protein
MEPLDRDNMGQVGSSDASLWPTALRFGAIGGVILVANGVLMHLTGMRESALNNVLEWVVWVGGTVLAIIHQRDKVQGGYITLGKAFRTGVAISAIVGIITGIWFAIYVNYINVGVFDELFAQVSANLEEDGQPQDVIDAMEGIMRFLFRPLPITLLVTLGGVVYGSIVSLFVGVVLKR